MSSSSLSQWFEEQVRPLTKVSFWLPMTAIFLAAGLVLYSWKQAEKAENPEASEREAINQDLLLFSDDLSQEDLDSLLLMREFDRASSAINPAAFNANQTGDNQPNKGLFDAVMNRGEDDVPVDLSVATSLPASNRSGSGAYLAQGGRLSTGSSQFNPGLTGLNPLGGASPFLGLGGSVNGAQTGAVVINPLQEALNRNLARGNSSGNSMSRSSGEPGLPQEGTISSVSANSSQYRQRNVLRNSYGNPNYPINGYGNVLGGQASPNVGVPPSVSLPGNQFSLGAGAAPYGNNSSANNSFNPSSYLPPAAYGVPPTIQSSPAVPSATPLNLNGSSGQQASQFSNQGRNHQFSHQGINANLNNQVNQTNQVAQPNPPFSVPRRVPGRYIGGGEINSFSNP